MSKPILRYILLGLGIITLLGLLIHDFKKDKDEELKEKAAEKAEDDSYKKYINDEATNILDSLIFYYEGSDSGKHIIDSLVDQYDIQKEKMERQDAEDSRAESEY